MTDLRLIPVPALADNIIWLLADGEGKAVVVDPGEAAPVFAVLARERLRVGTILLTHHHADHIAGAAELAAKTGATIHAPFDERIDGQVQRVRDGDQITIDAPRLRLEVIAIPGHTRSHVAYHGHGFLFSGDTLFSVGCGRLFEGTPAQMLASLERLATLPAAMLVCCGHEYTLANCTFARTLDPDNQALAARTADAKALRARGAITLPSTVASELACNPFLRIDSTALVHELGSGLDRVERFARLRELKDAFRMPAQ